MAHFASSHVEMFSIMLEKLCHRLAEHNMVPFTVPGPVSSAVCSVGGRVRLICPHTSVELCRGSSHHTRTYLARMFRK